jgi:hypothetical protein
MTSFSMIHPTKGGDFQSAWEGSERAFLRGWHDDARGGRKAVLAVVAGPETHGAASADHRQIIFRTLPQMAWEGEFFSSDIMWWLGDWTRL